MEPIRPDRSREWRNRRRGSSDAASAGAAHAGGFAQRMHPLDPTGSDQVTPSESGEVSFLGIPGVDEPTERLFDAVHSAGQRLVDQRTYTAALQYREAIRRFLQKVMPDANMVVLQESNRDILNRKRYYLLTEVNRSVDRLVQGLLQTQVQQLDILSRLEEIEGLLVDLLQ